MAAAAPAAAAVAGGAGGEAGGFDGNGVALPSFMIMKYRAPVTFGRNTILYDKLKKEKIKEALNTFRKRFVYVNVREYGRTESDYISKAPVGAIYTWIIKEDPSTPIGATLIAARTRSSQEIGTLHKNLDKLTPDIPGPVIAAGELRKIAGGVQYNYASGSYMAEDIALNPAKKSIAESITPKLLSSFGRAEQVGPNTNTMISETLQTALDNVKNYDNYFTTKSNTRPAPPSGGMGGGARRSRKGRRSAYCKSRKHRKSHKGRRTLRRGQ